MWSKLAYHCKKKNQEVAFDSKVIVCELYLPHLRVRRNIQAAGRIWLFDEGFLFLLIFPELRRDELRRRWLL